MEVWMTIGYSSREGDSCVDGVFTRKKDAVAHVLPTLFSDWSTNGKLGPIGYDEFARRITEYIMSHDEENEYWYLWNGTELICDLFPEVPRNNVNHIQVRDNCSWIGIEKTELK